VRRFRWLSAIAIPAAFDLRQRGWQLVGDDREGACPALAHIKNIDAACWIALLGVRGPELRRLILLFGVDDRDECARLLQLGFGDVLGTAHDIGEIEARAQRISELADTLPRFRDVGQLRLDLFRRDGIVQGKPLGLHPREFALIWRLTDTPGVPVRKSVLLTDVWRLAFVPDTNSLAVHIYRLRTKLALAGLDGLVQTSASGGYMLVPPGKLAPSGASFIRKDEPDLLTDEPLATWEPSLE
jgi:hypothetical protein